MPAPDKKTCLAIEDAVHVAVGAQLTAGGVPNTIPIKGDDLPDITVLPFFSLGPSNGHLHQLPTGGWEYDLFAPCSLVIELSVRRFTTDAVTLAAVYAVLGEQLALIRQALGFAVGNALNDRMLYHKLTHLVPNGTALGYNQERGEDVATIAYRCTAGIRPDAWPLA